MGNYKPSKKVVVLLLCVIGVMGPLLIWSLQPASKPTRLVGSASVQQQQQNNIAQPSAALTPQAAEPFTDAEVARVISDFVGNMRVRYFAVETMRELHMARMVQAAKFMDLDKYRQSAEQIKLDAMNARDEVMNLRRSLVLDTREKHDQMLDELGEAADKYAGAIVDVTVDLSAHANSGLDMSEDFAKNAKLSQQAKREFEKKVLAAYKLLGVKPGQIVRPELTLK
jgi:hypothetical protein